MLKITAFILVILANNSFAQLFQPFVFQENQPFVYDTIPQILAQKGISAYYKDHLNDAITYYDSVLLVKPTYYQAYFNLSRFLARNGQIDRSKEALKCPYPIFSYSSKV